MSIEIDALLDQEKYKQAEALMQQQSKFIQKYYHGKILYHREVRMVDAASIFEELIDKEPATSEEEELLPKIYLFLISTLLYSNDFQKAHDYLTRFESLLKPTDNYEEALYLQIQSRFDLGKGKLKDAIQQLQLSMKMFHDLQKWTDYTFSANLVVLNIPKYEEKLRCAVDLLDVITGTGYERLIAAGKCQLGYAHQAGGAFNQARKLNQEAVDIAVKMDFDQGVANASFCLATIALEEGRPQDAVKLFETANQIWMKNLRSSIAVAGLLSAYRMLGKPEKVLEYFKSDPYDKITLSQFGLDWVANTYIQMLLAGYEANQPEIASMVYKEFLSIIGGKKQYEDSPYTSLVKAIVMMHQNNLESIASAGKLLREVISQGNFMWFQLQILAIRHLCRLLLIEYDLFKNQSLLDEFAIYVNNLSEIASQQHLPRITFESGLLRSKLQLIDGKLNQSKSTLESLLEIAKEMQLGHYEKRLEIEISDFEANFSTWMQMVNSNTSIQNRIQKSRIMDYFRFASQVVMDEKE